MFSSKELGYDRSLTIFSPDGRLYQVEYANEAVRRGTTCIGLKGTDGVLVISLKGISRHSRLIEEYSLNKIFQIDDSIVLTGAGLLSDMQYLVENARIYSQNLQQVYGESSSAGQITRFIAKIKQSHTQTAGYRPFGVAIIIAGFNADESHGLYYTDPSGSYWEYKGIIIGEGSQELTEKLEDIYSFETISVLLPIACNLLKTYFPEIEPMDFDVVTIENKDKQIKRFSLQEIREIFEKILKEDR